MWLPTPPPFTQPPPEARYPASRTGSRTGSDPQLTSYYQIIHFELALVPRSDVPTPALPSHNMPCLVCRLVLEENNRGGGGDGGGGGSPGPSRLPILDADTLEPPRVPRELEPVDVELLQDLELELLQAALPPP